MNLLLSGVKQKKRKKNCKFSKRYFSQKNKVNTTYLLRVSSNLRFYWKRDFPFKFNWKRKDVHGMVFFFCVPNSKRWKRSEQMQRKKDEKKYIESFASGIYGHFISFDCMFMQYCNIIEWAHEYVHNLCWNSNSVIVSRKCVKHAIHMLIVQRSYRFSGTHSNISTYNCD